MKHSIRTVFLSVAIWFCLLLGFGQNPIVAATLADTGTSQETISEESISFIDRISATAKTIQDKFGEAVSKLTGESNDQTEMPENSSNQVDLKGEMTTDPTAQADLENVQDEVKKTAE
jgi:hypothetical protein